VLIVSAGFKRWVPEGRSSRIRVLSIAKSYDLRVLGPNCLGFSRPSHHVNARSHTSCRSRQRRIPQPIGALGTPFSTGPWATTSASPPLCRSVHERCRLRRPDRLLRHGSKDTLHHPVCGVDSPMPQVHEPRPAISPRPSRSWSSRRPHGAGSIRRRVAHRRHRRRRRLYDAASVVPASCRVNEIENLFDASEALSRRDEPARARGWRS